LLLRSLGPGVSPGIAGLCDLVEVEKWREISMRPKNPEADRAFFRDVLKFSSVDAGDAQYGRRPQLAGLAKIQSSGLRYFVCLRQARSAFAK
jgi:hypothetical protein